MSLTDKDTKSITDYRYKQPVFDGEKPSEFKDWWDNVFATLEMEDIEEYVTDTWKDKDMPTKVSTEPPADATDKVGTAKALKQKSFRKDMKKAKAHMVRVSKDYLKRLIMEADTPYQAYAALKTK